MVRIVVLPLLLLVIVITGSNCSKADTCKPNTPASEAPIIQEFITNSSINATAHPSGLYYEILDPGTGATATQTSKIAITYQGALMDGYVFDQRTSPNTAPGEGPDSPWPLNQLIEGWRVGIPLIKEGGRIKLVVPSAMGYGCTGYGAIPPNAVLFFEITLVDVQ